MITGMYNVMRLICAAGAIFSGKESGNGGSSKKNRRNFARARLPKSPADGNLTFCWRWPNVHATGLGSGASSAES